MTYRASALPGADGGLIGTAEHGVLGGRWIYDGCLFARWRRPGGAGVSGTLATARYTQTPVR
jgi:hypothetical protein